LSERKKVVQVTGKRKTAIAKAVVKPGKGKITVNGYPLEAIDPEIAREKMMEPLLLAGDKAKTVDIKVNVKGGGFMGQAEAVRMALVRALVKWNRSVQLKRLFTQYERTMMAGDPRQTEPKKFGGPGPRRRKQKSYR
jgi:small subunit ribosomal protein S9